MDLSRRLNLGGPNIVHDTIDGEVVIINLDNGNYYSLDGTGVEIWQLIVQEHTLSEIIAHLCSHYGTEATVIETAVRDLVGELATDDLIQVSTKESPRPPHHSAVLNAHEAASRPPFRPPNLSRYVDMQDLLLLDPIHDVDEAGWPHARLETDND